MGPNRLKTKGRKESGRFTGIPRVCMNSDNYIKLSPYAKVLLWEFCHQYNGFNNGDLCAAFEKVMKPRGWKSKGTLDRALKELRKIGWIILSRQGGLGIGCSLYALTFQAIDDCKGKLDISSTITAPGHWKN